MSDLSGSVFVSSEASAAAAAVVMAKEPLKCQCCNEWNIPIMSSVCPHSYCLNCLDCRAADRSSTSPSSSSSSLPPLDCPVCDAPNAFLLHDAPRHLNTRACELMETTVRLRIALSRQRETSRAALESDRRKHENDRDRILRETEQLKEERARLERQLSATSIGLDALRREEEEYEQYLRKRKREDDEGCRSGLVSSSPTGKDETLMKLSTEDLVKVANGNTRKSLVIKSKCDDIDDADDSSLVYSSFSWLGKNEALRLELNNPEEDGGLNVSGAFHDDDDDDEEEEKEEEWGPTSSHDNDDDDDVVDVEEDEYDDVEEEYADEHNSDNDTDDSDDSNNSDEGEDRGAGEEDSSEEDESDEWPSEEDESVSSLDHSPLSHTRRRGGKRRTRIGGSGGRSNLRDRESASRSPTGSGGKRRTRIGGSGGRGRGHGWGGSRPRDDVWMKHFEALKRFKEEHGHVVLPSRSQMGVWVNSQRNAYRGRSYITKERIALLDSIGFPWKGRGRSEKKGSKRVGSKPHDDIWMEHFEELKLFEKEHGHMIVPALSQLGIWAKTQRSAYRGRGYINEQRIALLESIGFPWVGRGGPLPVGKN